MQQISSFPLSIHFTWPRVRLGLRARWVAPVLMVLALALGVVLGLAVERAAPTDAIAEVILPTATTVPYVSSDPSVPPADSVKFSDPEPLPPTF
jgi:hypothetical protein